MTHPLTPREKVAATLDHEVWADDMPVPTRADVTDFHARRQASIVKANAILTALASGSGSGSGDQLSGNPGILKSGSGDHSGGVTDMIGSGDHAELARLAEAATPGEWDLDGHQCLSAPDGTIVVDYSCCSRGEWEANAAYLRAVQPSRTLALLAEIAALNDYGRSVAKEALGYRDRATEAERKLAEARSMLLRWRRHAPTEALEDLTDAFLSKEAERG